MDDTEGEADCLDPGLAQDFPAPERVPVRALAADWGQDELEQESVSLESEPDSDHSTEAVRTPLDAETEQSGWEPDERSDHPCPGSGIS